MRYWQRYVVIDNLNMFCSEAGSYWLRHISRCEADKGCRCFRGFDQRKFHSLCIVGAAAREQRRDFTQLQNPFPELHEVIPLFKQYLCGKKNLTVGYLIILIFFVFVRNYYYANNKQLPTDIFFYRDGVGAGDINRIKEFELEALKVIQCYFVYIILYVICIDYFNWNLIWNCY